MKKVNIDKFYIGIPSDTFANLNRDAEFFGIYKGNNMDVNMNDFLSRLIVGYFKEYKKERNDKINRIQEMIGPWIHDPKKADELAERMMKEIVQTPIPKRKGKNTERLPYKPTRETDQSITEIKGIAGSYTEYLCRMLMSYCDRPIYERERIIFRDNTVFLKDACKWKRAIVFTTVSKPDVIHRVIPYDLAVGKDELCNYLLCQEYNPYTQRTEPASYRLCRICNPDYSETSGSLDDTIVNYLEKMKKQGAQFAITENTDICVRLTPAGQKSYRRIYYARPAVDKDRIEMLDDGSALYRFKASAEQVFRFVIRFRAGEAEIMSPPELREKIYQYYKEAVLPYEKEK